jgi:hypothetical protein
VGCTPLHFTGLIAPPLIAADVFLNAVCASIGGCALMHCRVEHANKRVDVHCTGTSVMLERACGSVPPFGLVRLLCLVPLISLISNANCPSCHAHTSGHASDRSSLATLQLRGAQATSLEDEAVRNGGIADRTCYRRTLNWFVCLCVSCVMCRFVLSLKERFSVAMSWSGSTLITGCHPGLFANASAAICSK